MREGVRVGESDSDSVLTRIKFTTMDWFLYDEKCLLPIPSKLSAGTNQL